jgi:hypothetical protein
MSTLTRILIDNMAGANDVAPVTNALKTVNGAGRLTVELHPGATSKVSILSALPLDETALRSAIGATGYPIVGYTVTQDALAEEMKHQAPARQAVRTVNTSPTTPTTEENTMTETPTSENNCCTSTDSNGCGCGVEECGCTCNCGGTCGGNCGCPDCKCPPLDQATDTAVNTNTSSNDDCQCGCKGEGRQGLGVGLPIVAKD